MDPLRPREARCLGGRETLAPHLQVQSIPDTSVPEGNRHPINHDKAIYETAKAIGIQDKILFGSDYPLVSPKRYEKWLLETALSVEEQANIWGGNARRLLNSCNICI